MNLEPTFDIGFVTLTGCVVPVDVVFIRQCPVCSAVDLNAALAGHHDDVLTVAAELRKRYVPLARAADLPDVGAEPPPCKKCRDENEANRANVCHLRDSLNEILEAQLVS